MTVVTGSELPIVKDSVSLLVKVDASGTVLAGVSLHITTRVSVGSSIGGLVLEGSTVLANVKEEDSPMVSSGLILPSLDVSSEVPVIFIKGISLGDGLGR
jgi:hypothetical protein